jgi:hypothetical protein
MILRELSLTHGVHAYLVFQRNEGYAQLAVSNPIATFRGFDALRGEP